SQYYEFAWRTPAAIPRLTHRFAELAPPEKDVLLMRLANELEEYLDLGILHCEDAKQRVLFCEIYGSYMVDLAAKLGHDDLVQMLTQAFDWVLDRRPVTGTGGDSATIALPLGGSPADALAAERSEKAVQSHPPHHGNAFQEFPREAIAQSISRRFEHQVTRHPNQVAVDQTTGSLSYRALHERADRLARGILARFGPGNDPVATLCGHDANMVVSALGIFKAGKIWIPLDASHPAERLSSIAADGKPVCMLTEDALAPLARSVAESTQTIITLSDAINSDSGSDIIPEVSPDALACVLYTSGSTGTPKGVIHNHRNLLHLTRRGTNAFRISAHDRLTLLPSCSQIAGLTDLLRALLNGATLLPFDVRENSVQDLGRWLNEKRISIYHSSPTLFRLLTEGLAGTNVFPSIRLIHLGGEAMTQADVARYKEFFSAGCTLVNNLGCTELSGYRQFIMGCDFTPAKDIVPAGYAVEDVEVSVRDDDGEAVPAGHVGEITVTSPYLALGYWRRPEETHASFRHHGTARGARSYRTGDLGYLLADGCLVYSGRKDDQVQIRGNRVHAAEIEAALAAHSAVRRAAVKVSRSQEEPLTAYIVPHGDAIPSIPELRNFVKTKLPAYMIPSMVFVEELPLTPNGKVNYKKLGQPATPGAETRRAYTPPRTQTEQVLARLWIELLGTEPVGIDDDFFDMGGDSLVCMRLASLVEREFGVHINLNDVFQHPTLGQLATVIVARCLGDYSDRSSNSEQKALLTILSEVEGIPEQQAQAMLRA
ncbi:MAG: AMP-binding protein, partial [Gammaproteobacteria bacterium]|nr:AMP-binding protein [Gammaproteobacteria bacterium]